MRQLKCSTLGFLSRKSFDRVTSRTSGQEDVTFTWHKVCGGGVLQLESTGISEELGTLPQLSRLLSIAKLKFYLLLCFGGVDAVCINISEGLSFKKLIFLRFS